MEIACWQLVCTQTFSVLFTNGFFPLFFKNKIIFSLSIHTSIGIYRNYNKFYPFKLLVNINKISYLRSEHLLPIQTRTLLFWCVVFWCVRVWSFFSTRCFCCISLVLSIRIGIGTAADLHGIADIGWLVMICVFIEFIYVNRCQCCCSVKIEWNLLRALFHILPKRGRCSK